MVGRVYVVGLDFFLRSQPVPSLAMPTLLNFSPSLRSPRSRESGIYSALRATDFRNISFISLLSNSWKGEKSSARLQAVSRRSHRSEGQAIWRMLDRHLLLPQNFFLVGGHTLPLVLAYVQFILLPKGVPPLLMQFIWILEFPPGS